MRLQRTPAELSEAESIPLPEAFKLKALLESFLSERPHKEGESITLGWFVFWIVESGRPPRLKSLDFLKMASFTEDLSAAERIRAWQSAALAEFEVEASPCSMLQTAIVSASYSLGRDDVFLERQKAASEGHSSGWFVGVFDDPLDFSDPASCSLKSLYELTINDLRMAPYWLLPPGTLVLLSEEIRKDIDADGEPPPE